MKIFSLILIALINVFFSYKYLGRAIDQALLASLLVGAATFIVPYFLLRWDLKKFSATAIWSGILGLFSIAYIYYFYWLNPTELNVDRWSVVTSFWDAFFNGEYPYMAQSHKGNMPGPLPFFFILCLPFYLLGNMGWVTLCSVWSFFIYLYRNKPNTTQWASAFFLLFISTPILWELAVLSNLLFNTILVIFYIHYLTREPLTSWKQVLFWGLLTGFMISTRAIFVIPIALAVVLYFKKYQPSFREILLFSGMTLLGIGLSFAPFIIGNWDLFWKYNPFVLQSTHFMPLWLSATFILIAVILGFYIRRETLLFTSGMIIFATIFTYFVYAIITFGWEEAYFESKMDISYLIMALPFLILSSVKNKQDQAGPKEWVSFFSFKV